MPIPLPGATPPLGAPPAAPPAPAAPAKPKQRKKGKAFGFRKPPPTAK
jgi:hypothetical protein